MTFTDNPVRDYERFCDAQDHGAGDEETPVGGFASVEAIDYTAYPSWKLYALGLEIGASGEALKRPGTKPLGEEQWKAFEEGWKDGRVGFEEELGKFQKDAALFLSDAEAEASAALAAAGDEEGWGSKRDNANPRGKFWDSEEPVRHEELYREDLEEPQDVF